MANAAQRLTRMLAELGRVTEEPGRLTRTFLSPAMQQANTLVAEWMREAGLKVRVDSLGNLIGRLEAGAGRTRGGAPTVRGTARSSGKTPTLLLGSHLDTVRDAGKFDGALGVLLPLVALTQLGRRGVKLPFAVEVVGFSEEEGVRFASAYLGSEGFTGRLQPGTLGLRDAQGVSVGEVLRQFNGGEFSLPGAAHERRDLLGYVEVHIEQGPVLENENLAVGVVAGIAGQRRGKFIWKGQAGHAGTTPMNVRRDALAGAAEFALAVEALARRTPGLVATIGELTVRGGAANVIPGEVVHTLDVRHARDGVRRAALLRLSRLAGQIARRRGLKVTEARTQDHAAIACSRALTARLARCVRAVQDRSLALVSGAGHDAVVMARLTPVAMLFVRCRAGLSHHPREHVSPADLAVALQVMEKFLEQQAAAQSQ